MATTMEALTTCAAVLTPDKGPRQFQDLFTVIPFTFTLEEDSLGAGDAGTADITVTGAALGDFVLVAPGVDLVSLVLTAFVQSANTVTIQLQNQESDDANTTLATVGTANGLILKPRSAWAVV